jgi:hypothetical protein
LLHRRRELLATGPFPWIALLLQTKNRQSSQNNSRMNIMRMQKNGKDYSVSDFSVS